MRCQKRKTPDEIRAAAARLIERHDANFDAWLRRFKLEWIPHRRPREPENRAGFFAQLTQDQQKAAIAYRGPENIGGACQPEKEGER